MNSYKRRNVADIEKSLEQKLPFLQILVGPRQVGNTTAALSLAKGREAYHYASADSPLPHGSEWLEAQWSQALRRKDALLVIDEIHKVAGWSEIVKKLWDEGRARNDNLQVILLGSSSLLMQRGLTESLAGRFQMHYFPHWSYLEGKECFGLSLEEWIYLGGYPGYMVLRRDEAQWKSYIANSLVETAIARDVMGLDAVNKPVLLRNLFGICTTYPGEIVSYSKILGSTCSVRNQNPRFFSSPGYLRPNESARTRVLPCSYSCKLRAQRFYVKNSPTARSLPK